jgi:uncharacterized membrane protein YhaH (DUF805 family)
MEWILAPLKKYAVFSGRARRREFWPFMLINYAILGALYVPFRSDPTSVFALVFFAYALAVLVPTIAVFVRRLHDVDKSGWWYFINFVPFVGGIILLVICLPAGTPGANEFGPDPKGPYAA